MPSTRTPRSPDSVKRQSRALPKLREEITIVVDTNVIVDVFSCHDYFNATKQLGGAKAPVDHPQLVYRRARARESLLFAICMHNRRHVSRSLWEIHEIIKRAVPISDPTEFTWHFIAMSSDFVKGRILSEWIDGVPHRRQKVEPAKDDADDELVRLAKRYGVPLVSNEGYTQKGIVPNKKAKPNIVDKARAAGVPIFTPRQFYDAEKRDPAQDITWFLWRIKREAGEYIRASDNPDRIRNALGWAYGLYDHVLLGKTVGQKTLAKVAVY